MNNTEQRKKRSIYDEDRNEPRKKSERRRWKRSWILLLFRCVTFPFRKISSSQRTPNCWGRPSEMEFRPNRSAHTHIYWRARVNWAGNRAHAHAQRAHTYIHSPIPYVRDWDFRLHTIACDYRVFGLFLNENNDDKYTPTSATTTTTTNYYS